ncbi:hypothetical protein [Parasitella parasitica]|uniref:Uncharacterized protein n=1 Tax=Parasitella parasitica TaxID=35722 RepID=A0A0B7NRZ0_9FUNG|nr:hypothetical protein [Parasitella parasitica]
MTFTIVIALYIILITAIMNFYGTILASRNSTGAQFDMNDAQTTENDQIESVRHKVHENKVIGNAIQAISQWIDATNLSHLVFDIKNEYNCHRDLAKNVILQLFSHQDQNRLTALLADIYSENNTRLAKSIAKLALVAIDLDGPATLSVLTEALLTCNDYSVMNFIQFSVNQNTALAKNSTDLPHTGGRSMEFENLLLTAGECISNQFKRKDKIHGTGVESAERIAVSALEKISRLQAAIGFIVPTSIQDIASEKPPGRRISNSSMLTTTSGISSCISPSISSSSSSNTSCTDHAEIAHISDNKEYTNVLTDMLKPSEATYYDIVKFKIDLLLIRTEVCELLDQLVLPLTATAESIKSIDRIKQVDQAFRTLIFTCMTTEQALNNLQSGFVFDQLGTHFASHLITEAITKLYQQSKIKIYQQHDFKDLSTIVKKALNVTSSLLQAFLIDEGCTPEYYSLTNMLTDRCCRLALAYKSINTVWNRVVDIRRTIDESSAMLSMIHYNEYTSYESLKLYMSALQSIFKTFYLCGIEKLHPLHDLVEQQIESNDINHYQGEEKIIIGMVNSLFSEFDTVKLQITKISQDLIKLSDRREFVTDLNNATRWVKSMNYTLGLFIAIEALFSFDTITADQQALQSRYAQFQEEYSKFTLTKYDKICAYFAKDYDTGLNYQKLGDTTMVHTKDEEYTLFEKLQLVADQSSKLLAYAHEVLLQRKAITEYVQHLNDVQQNSDEELLYEQIVAALSSFNRIQYPELNITGLSNTFYYYHHDLYRSLSDAKVNMIDNYLQC